VPPAAVAQQKKGGEASAVRTTGGGVGARSRSRATHQMDHGWRRGLQVEYRGARVAEDVELRMGTQVRGRCVQEEMGIGSSPRKLGTTRL
jgi:hypothetical protein